MTSFGYAIVFVSDMEKSIAFYRDVLGFPVTHHSHKWTEFGSVSRQLVLLGTLLCLLTTPGCFASRPPGVSRIRGGMEDYYPKGRLTTLKLERPDGQVVVAVRFPKPIDESWYPGFGHSGNGDDITHWEDIYKVRFQGGDDSDVLTIAWEYSSRTRKLLFGGKQFDLPDGKLAILGYDKEMKPSCELRDHSKEVVEQLRKELGAKHVDALPTTAEPTP